MRGFETSNPDQHTINAHAVHRQGAGDEWLAAVHLVRDERLVILEERQGLLHMVDPTMNQGSKLRKSNIFCYMLPECEPLTPYSFPGFSAYPRTSSNQDSN